MADSVKAASLSPCEDEDVLGEIGQLCGKIHRSLESATIRVFWAKEKPLKWWGMIKIASEQAWWISGAAESGVDILLTLNEALWIALPRAARTGLLDHFLDQVKRKESGQTEMATEVGMRPLFERNESTLKLSDRVCARNPEFVQAIRELKRLWRALSDPAQFELELEAAGEDDDPDGDGEDEDTIVVAAPAKRGRKPKAPGPLASAPVVHYFERKNLEEFGPTVLRFTEADFRPESLDGVYYLTDGEKDPADVTGLAYKTDPVAVRPVRAALEEEHQGWASAALSKGKADQATA